jgi:hypothetical protein
MTNSGITLTLIEKSWVSRLPGACACVSTSVGLGSRLARLVTPPMWWLSKAVRVELLPNGHGLQVGVCGSSEVPPPAPEAELGAHP